MEEGRVSLKRAKGRVIEGGRGWEMRDETYGGRAANESGQFGHSVRVIELTFRYSYLRLEDHIGL